LGKEPRLGLFFIFTEKERNESRGFSEKLNSPYALRMHCCTAL
jgi:hypothetical protein